MEAMIEDDNRILAEPFSAKMIKDYSLTVFWPKVYKQFYPFDYTFGDVLKEVHLYDYFHRLWTETTVEWIIILVKETIGIEEGMEGALRAVLWVLVNDIMQVLYN